MAIILNIGKIAETETHRTYWLSLGRFIHRFALLEQQIHYLLRIASKISRQADQALLSGTRADAAISLLRRSYEVHGETEDPVLTRAIAQFGIINSARNDVVHMGAIQDGDAFLVTNQNRTIASKARTNRFTAEILDQMTADLETISAAVFVAQEIANRQPPTQKPIDWLQVAQSPWLYKLQPPARIPGKRQRTIPKPSPLPQS
jgi:hypothetical protein